MNRDMKLFGICVVFVLFGAFAGMGVALASATTIYVPDNYAKIQWAVNNASDGDTIIVRSGTYYENVLLNKTLTLKGEGMPVVDAQRSGNAITVTADGCTIEGFKVTGAYHWIAGLRVNSNSNRIINNTASGNTDGILLSSSSNNTLIGNIVINNNFYGIHLSHSCNNTLNSNSVSNNRPYGIYLESSPNNTLNCNTASNNNFGIYLWFSPNNTLRDNAMNNNLYGFSVKGGSRKSHFIQDIDTSNKVNGKPIYYIVNEENKVIDSTSNAGYVGVVSSSNITLRDLTLENNGEGVLFIYTSDSKIENIVATNNYDFGICLRNSFNNRNSAS